jgi:hypothetical protein
MFEMSDKAIACPKCGCPVLKDTEKINLLQCPRCNSNDIKKISLVYESGAQNINALSSGISSGGIFGSNAAFYGTATSLWAQRFSPPGKYIRGLGVFYTVFALLIFMVIAISRASSKTSIFIFFGGLAILIVIIFFGLRKHKERTKEYRQLLHKWRCSWVCTKCGNIFVIEDK